MGLDREKERELDDLHTQVRKIEMEKKQLQDKIAELNLRESKIKEQINALNDDNYVEQKLQLLYDQRHENMGKKR